MKQYNGEKAIISLTSWKARINTVSKTLYSLLQQCPGFHIVLVLSEEEFPKKEEELPENLRLFIDNNLIEILWVYKNYKSFKKVLFTMDKYRDVPIISADDDCVYVCNYAQMLYDEWMKHPDACISCTKSDDRPPWPCGHGTLHSKIHFNLLLKEFKKLNHNAIQHSDDDGFFRKLYHTNNIKILGLSWKYPCFYHDETLPLNGSMKYKAWIKKQSFNDKEYINA